MLAIAAVAYAVTAVAPDSGYSLSINRTNCFIPSSLYDLESPENITISEDGTLVAFVEYPKGRCGEDRIVVLRNGRRLRIARPELGVASDDSNDYSVSALKITDSAQLFATLSDRFSGAYMGTRKAVFIWANHEWQSLDISIDRPYCDDNTSIAAVESADVYSLNLDCDAEFLPSPEDAENPENAARAVQVKHGKVIALGVGTVTSMNGFKVAGYVNGLQHQTPPNVIIWADNRHSNIGSGVGFGVDSDGSVVGDDRKSWSRVGRPTLWDHHVKKLLSSESGSAFAIRDGTIVGTIAGRAFVAQAKNVPESVQYLEAGGKLTIITAFAVAKSGRILALGKDDSGGFEILLLDPPLAWRKAGP